KPPASVAIELEEARTIGGVVRDEAGKPVAGATVKFANVFHKNPGELDQWSSVEGQSAKTGADGKWTFDAAPPELEDIRIYLSHPDYLGDAAGGTTRMPPAKELLARTAEMVIRKG